MCNKKEDYPWVKQIHDLPTERGFLSDKALDILLEVGHDLSRPKEERQRAIDWYCSAT